MLSRDRLLSLGVLGALSLGVITARVGSYVVTPLWLDFFNNLWNLPAWNITYPNATGVLPATNFTKYPAKIITHHVGAQFIVLGQWGCSAIVTGILLLWMLLCCPGKISNTDRGYSKLKFFIIGFSQALSSILMTFSSSGSRVAPYLQGLLSNFNIPIQFTTRFLLLRKRPTWTKAWCALTVLIAEFVCLIPTIFPGLESQSDKREEGGATGAGAVLWPVCMVSSQIPYAVANTLMEKSVQDKKAVVPQSNTKINDGETDVEEETEESLVQDDAHEEEHKVKEEQINIIYFTFWWSFFITLTCAAFFWVDLIPGFGTAGSIGELWDMMSFSAGCMVGVSPGCHGTVVALGWLNFFFALLGALTFSTLMRYSEGSNYVVIVLAFRTPLVFLFWTLFQESPFGWNPHLALSTYLSIAAIMVMIPAVVVYNTGLWCPAWCALPCRSKDSASPEAEPLLRDPDDVTINDAEHSQINS